MSEPVLLKIENQVARIQLNRADIHNAFNEVSIAALTDVFLKVGQDPDIRVVVLESFGKSFCAGADLAWMKKMAGYTEQENIDDTNALAKMLRLLNEMPKPTIARVQGPAYGGGVGLVACCDIAVAVDTATFCLSEVLLGLSPATISPYVINAMGSSQARRYFLTAERIPAAQAEKINLVHEVCSADELDKRVNYFITQLLKAGPRALGIAKELIFLSEPMVDERILKETALYIARQRVSPEGQEGLASFFEKRKPDWIR